MPPAVKTKKKNTLLCSRWRYAPLTMVAIPQWTQIALPVMYHLAFPKKRWGLYLRSCLIRYYAFVCVFKNTTNNTLILRFGRLRDYTNLSRKSRRCQQLSCSLTIDCLTKREDASSRGFRWWVSTCIMYFRWLEYGLTRETNGQCHAPFKQHINYSLAL